MQLQMQEHTRQLAESLAKSKMSSPSVSWPKWDGSTAGIPAFLEQLKTLQRDKFFKGANWSKKIAGFDDQSTWLRSNILQNLPQQELRDL